MSGWKWFGGGLVVLKSLACVAVASLAVGCTQPTGDGSGDGTATNEAVLDGDESAWNGPRGSYRRGVSSVDTGNTLLRGRLDLGGRPPWDKGPHPDPWAPPQPDPESSTPSGSTGTGTGSSTGSGTSSSSGGSNPNGK
jgi:hypothetical protein